MNAVDDIELVGAPWAVLIDAGARIDKDSAITGRLAALLAALGIEVADPDAHVPRVDAMTVGIFGHPHDPIAGCHAWWVGLGDCPSWMQRARGHGAHGAIEIVSLLGSGFEQERAGVAFRSAGRGEAIPSASVYEADAILGGIDDAVAVRKAAVTAIKATPTSRTAVLARSAQILASVCTKGGAIAASTQAAPDAPDYWFFWLRDSAHCAAALATVGADDLLERYLGFVEELGLRLERHKAGVGVSRCTMDGEPLEGYGNPQWDGPAATALVVLSVVHDSDRALRIARPYLDGIIESLDAPPSYDLWELRVGHSFHALNLTRRALRKAALVASNSSLVARYQESEAECLARLAEHRNSEKGTVDCNRGSPSAWTQACSGLDMSVIGSALLCYDVSDESFNVDDPGIAATMAALDVHYQARWAINDAWSAAGHQGRGIGRFPEDCNDGFGSTGANPWPVTTLWAAQFFARTAQRQSYLGAATASIDAAASRAEGYLDFVLAHGGVGELGEQIDAENGSPVGARPLAWSHAELIQTVDAARQL